VSTAAARRYKLTSRGAVEEAAGLVQITMIVVFAYELTMI